MTYEQLFIAFEDARRRRDHDQCMELLDRFIESAQGPDLGNALSLKAGYFMLHHERRCIEGFGLVEEAMELLAGHPYEQFRTIIRGLGLCYTTGDVERAKRYEAMGYRFLQEYPDHPSIQAAKVHLYMNLFNVAWVRQELAKAYWLLVQAAQIVLGAPDLHPPAKFRGTMFRVYIRTAEVCLEMQRTPEAEDALTKAHDYINSVNDQRAWQLLRSQCLLAKNQIAGARASLEEIASGGKVEDWSSTSQVFYLLIRAMVAHAEGDIRGFHFHLARAQDCALEHGLDHMLARIQRMMRTPTRMEVTK